MTSRSKERMAAAFRRLFRSLKTSKSSGPVADGSEKNESPARRMLRHGFHRDSIQPAAEVPLPPSPVVANKKTVSGLFKSKRLLSESDNKQCSSSSQQHQQKVRSRRLMKELKDAQRLHQNNTLNPFFTVELVNDNLYEWHVRLYKIDSDSELAADMRELSIPYILLHITFPDNFPFAPPFMRVISPRIEKGFVMEGGAICMELLTPRGWASAYTVEAVIMQFAASLVKGQGRITRKSKHSKDFSRRSAEEAFRSLVKTHEKYGWVTPPMNDG